MWLCILQNTALVSDILFNALYMFNVIVNKEYELLFERLKAEAPDSFALSLADFSHPD